MVQKAPLRILVYLTGGMHWMGGVQYTRNLLRAVVSLPPDERPEIVLQIGRINMGHGYEEEFSNYPGVVIDGPRFASDELTHGIIRRLRRVWGHAFGREMPGKLLRSDDCDVAFPAKGPNIPGPAQKVYWVPDFQYKHFPEFFSEQERQQRDITYDRMFSETGILVLSSEAAREDFSRFFPRFAEKDVRVLHFVTTLQEEDFAPNPKETCARYGLPEKFAYLPNQMWQHKGFDTAFKALALLKDQGIEIPLVCTGNEVDYRTDVHTRELHELIAAGRLAGNIFMLGLLSRKDQLQIFRCAALILQPSRFEGWSTAVEDARALGRPIVLSDIPVHLEQDPPHATFFATGDAKDLSTRLASAWTIASPGPDPERETAAREAGLVASHTYGRRFLSIMGAASSAASTP